MPASAAPAPAEGVPDARARVAAKLADAAPGSNVRFDAAELAVLRELAGARSTTYRQHYDDMRREHDAHDLAMMVGAFGLVPKEALHHAARRRANQTRASVDLSEETGSRRRRGCDVDIPRRRVAATTWIVRGGASRRRRGRDVDLSEETGSRRGRGRDVDIPRRRV